MKFKEGDYVKITAREVTPNDLKNGTYYPYFCDLAGTVDRIYDKEICIKVDLDTLPESMLKRHLDVQESIRRKWLNGLSGEARNRLTSEEKRFDLSYTILVQSVDLEKAKPGTVKPAEIKSVRPVSAPETPAARAITIEDDIESEPEEEEEIQEVEAPQPAVKVRKTKAAKPEIEAAPAVAVPKAKATAKPAVPKAVKPTEAKPTPKAVAKPEMKATSAIAEPKAKAMIKPKATKVKVESSEPEEDSDLTPAEKAFLKEREKALKGKK